MSSPSHTPSPLRSRRGSTPTGSSSLSGSALTDSSNEKKCHQVMLECIQKAAEVVVLSRLVFPTQGAGRQRKTRVRFNLEIEEVELVRRSMEAWNYNLYLPLRIDVFWQGDSQGEGGGYPPRVLLERWCIDYKQPEAPPAGDVLAQLRHVCRRIIILLRALYSYVRILPAHQLYRRLSQARNGKVDKSDSYSISVGEDLGLCLYTTKSSGGSLSFPSGASTATYRFDAIDTPYGRLDISVTHRRSLEDALESYRASPLANNYAGRIEQNILIADDYVPVGEDGKDEEEYCGAAPDYPSQHRERDDAPDAGGAPMSGLGEALRQHNQGGGNVAWSSQAPYSSTSQAHFHSSPLPLDSARASSKEQSRRHYNSTAGRMLGNVPEGIPIPGSNSTRSPHSQRHQQKQQGVLGQAGMPAGIPGPGPMVRGQSRSLDEAQRGADFNAHMARHYAVQQLEQQKLTQLAGPYGYGKPALVPDPAAGYQHGGWGSHGQGNNGSNSASSNFDSGSGRGHEHGQSQPHGQGDSRELQTSWQYGQDADGSVGGEGQGGIHHHHHHHQNMPPQQQHQRLQHSLERRRTFNALSRDVVAMRDAAAEWSAEGAGDGDGGIYGMGIVGASRISATPPTADTPPFSFTLAPGGVPTASSSCSSTVMSLADHQHQQQLLTGTCSPVFATPIDDSGKQHHKLLRQEQQQQQQHGAPPITSSTSESLLLLASATPKAKLESLPVSPFQTGVPAHLLRHQGLLSGATAASAILGGGGYDKTFSVSAPAASSRSLLLQMTPSTAYTHSTMPPPPPPPPQPSHPPARSQSQQYHYQQQQLQQQQLQLQQDVDSEMDMLPFALSTEVSVGEGDGHASDLDGLGSADSHIGDRALSAFDSTAELFSLCSHEQQRGSIGYTAHRGVESFLGGSSAIAGGGHHPHGHGSLNLLGGSSVSGLGGNMGTMRRSGPAIKSVQTLEEELDEFRKFHESLIISAPETPQVV